MTAPPLMQRWNALKAARRSTIGAWFCGASSIVLVWLQSRWYVFHPHYLPLTLLFAGLVLSTLAAIVCSTWHLICGPGRWRGAIVLVAALPPIGIWSYVGTTANSNSSERWVPNTFAMRAAKVMGATFMRLEAELFYRQRMESDRIVMFYDPYQSPYVESVDRPAEDLAAMDLHLAHLENLLGAKTTGQIYWIRGPLLGREFLSLHGLSLGSAWSPAISSESSMGYRGDRHELAHALLDWHRTPMSDPPYVLHEGWAMAQCGDTRADLAQAAAKEKAKNPQLRLRDLFGPTWYHRGSGPVYTIGGAFVEFLIRTFDGRRFRRFYTECTPNNVDSKCREIFEIEFDVLETNFWNDLNASMRQCVNAGEISTSSFRCCPFLQITQKGEGVTSDVIGFAALLLMAFSAVVLAATSVVSLWMTRNRQVRVNWPAALDDGVASVVSPSFTVAGVVTYWLSRRHMKSKV